MIGTGIYSAPVTVFLLTGSKWFTLFLFSLGFLYTILKCVSVLVELDRRLCLLTCR